MSKKKYLLKPILKVLTIMLMMFSIVGLGRAKNASADPGYAGDSKVIKLAANTNKVLTQEGNSVVVKEFDGSDSQLWDIKYVSSDDEYYIRNKQSKQYIRCYYGDSTSIQLSNYDTFEAGWNLYNMYGSGRVVMQSKIKPKFYMRIDSNDTAVLAYNEYDYRDYASFYIEDPEINEGNYTVSLFKNKNLVFDKSMNSNDNNALIAFESNGSDNQKWTFIYDIKKEAYQIKSVYDNNLVISYGGNSTGLVFVNSNKNDDSQYWIKETMSDGTVRFKNYEYGNKYLNEWNGAILASPFDESRSDSYLFELNKI